MLVEVMRRNFLASMVPVIVNAILNGHQIVVDIVAFVARGDFPRSRLGEKQRGKILASWVTRKMRTIAQFGIKDANADLRDDPSASRRSGTSFRTSSVRGGSSLKHVESSSMLADLEEKDYAPLPEGIAEMPAMDSASMAESPPRLAVPHEAQGGQDDLTPTASTLTADGGTMSTAMASDIYGTSRHPDIPELDGSHDGDADDDQRSQLYQTVPYLSLPDVDAGGAFFADEGDHSVGTGGGLKIANRTSWSEDRDFNVDPRAYDDVAGRNPHAQR